eukprot:TRINITY_DN2458_c0_g2_i1.p1 TRINITY_DN2458_c0_g2~~TRINITY_DN2458_c0_g2_i1.p1  ORF type:complete len:414 (+),score=93.67 TRINITY_DN2458_c0_g2_i1:104-1345(+)
MANRTDPRARSIHGTNPQNLVEKILRSKIYQNTYWKEQCFGLTAETLVDKAMELDHFGGTFGGNRKATPFMCLILKMLQIQPEKEIVVEFIKNEDYKYVRILGAFYLRLIGKPLDVYQYLEPLYNDYRKLRRKLADGNFSLSHVDEVVDELLTKDYSCDIALPRVPKRFTLEVSGQLEPRRSALEDDFEEEEEEKGEEEHLEEERTAANGSTEDVDRERRRSRSSPARDRGRGRDREDWRDRDYRDRDRDRDREQDRERAYGRDRERERDRGGGERHSERNGRDRDGHRDRERDRGERGERERDLGGGGGERERRPSTRGDGAEGAGGSPERRWKRQRSRSPPAGQRHGARREEMEVDGDTLMADGAREGDRKSRRSEKKEKAAPRADGTDHADPEIAEANRLRASLGLKPLR